MKVILILALAKSVSNHNRFTFNKSFQTDLVLFFKNQYRNFTVPMALILLQNDLGTTLVICAIIIGIMLVSRHMENLAPLFIVALFWRNYYISYHL